MKIKKSIASLTLISLAIGFFALIGLLSLQFIVEKQEFTVEFEKGESLSRLAEDLKSKGLIYSEDFFKVTAVLMDYDKKLQPGEYHLDTTMNGLQMLDKISSGKVVYRRVTIPEGLTVAEIKQMLNKNEYLVGEPNIEIKEGYLLPETYSFRKGDTRNSILLQMQSQMETHLNQVWQNRDKSIDKYIKSKEELLKLASIVEKETIIDLEKPLVANVYINRLKSKMRLQADPTVIYGAKDYQGDITYKMLRDKNDYNTYVIFGLPKTAIANPGLESLKAVANPAKTDYLFFVADGKGGHVFSHTYDQHKQKVKEYLEIRKQQGFIK